MTSLICSEEMIRTLYYFIVNTSCRPGAKVQCGWSRMESRGDVEKKLFIFKINFSLCMFALPIYSFGENVNVLQDNIVGIVPLHTNARTCHIM